jgi:hypothetical protein
MLGERLWYLADKNIAEAMITGTYKMPLELDPATRLILEEVGRMGATMLKGKASNITRTPDELKHFWRRVNKFTSLSMSGIHYGHYVATTQDNELTRVMAQQLTIVAKSGIPPDSWSVGLQVMLEKMAGVCLVEKLRAIQLYEADFNCYNQFIFGRHVMKTTTDNRYIPKELFSQKGSTAEDAKFDKTLMVDISRQARLPMTTVSVDAAKRQSKPRHHVSGIVSDNHWQHPSNSRHAHKPTNNENLPTHWIQRI